MTLVKSEYITEAGMCVLRVSNEGVARYAAENNNFVSYLRKQEVLLARHVLEGVTTDTLEQFMECVSTLYIEGSAPMSSPVVLGFSINLDELRDVDDAYPCTVYYWLLGEVTEGALSSFSPQYSAPTVPNERFCEPPDWLAFDMDLVVNVKTLDALNAETAARQLEYEKRV